MYNQFSMTTFMFYHKINCCVKLLISDILIMTFNIFSTILDLAVELTPCCFISSLITSL